MNSKPDYTAMTDAELSRAVNERLGYGVERVTGSIKDGLGYPVRTPFYTWTYPNFTWAQIYELHPIGFPQFDSEAEAWSDMTQYAEDTEEALNLLVSSGENINVNYFQDEKLFWVRLYMVGEVHKHSELARAACYAWLHWKNTQE